MNLHPDPQFATSASSEVLAAGCQMIVLGLNT